MHVPVGPRPAEGRVGRRPRAGSIFGRWTGARGRDVGVGEGCPRPDGAAARLRQRLDFHAVAARLAKRREGPSLIQRPRRPRSRKIPGGEYAAPRRQRPRPQGNCGDHFGGAALAEVERVNSHPKPGVRLQARPEEFGLGAADGVYASRRFPGALEPNLALGCDVGGGEVVRQPVACARGGARVADGVRVDQQPERTRLGGQPGGRFYDVVAGTDYAEDGVAGDGEPGDGVAGDVGSPDRRHEFIARARAAFGEEERGVGGRRTVESEVHQPRVARRHREGVVARVSARDARGFAGGRP